MELTREQAIRNHRQMWNWIADETERQHRCVDKEEALEHFGVLNHGRTLVADCWLCTYNGNPCSTINSCLLKWPGGRCAPTSRLLSANNQEYPGLFIKWYSALRAGLVQLAAELARQIANLPEASI